MLQRIDGVSRRAMEAMNVQPNKKSRKAKEEAAALASPLQGKVFESAAFGSKTYNTAAFEGTKSANIKTFETRSFFGIKNPWFGRRVFATDSSSFAGREAAEAKRGYNAGAYAVNKYEKAGKADLRTEDTVLPTAAAPRTYRGAENPNKDKGIDKFTQNLSKDLSIDDVRDLLNKGKGE